MLLRKLPVQAPDELVKHPIAVLSEAYWRTRFDSAPSLIDDTLMGQRTGDENVFLDRMITTLSVAFAVLATILAAIGLYGVLAYTVA
jgi:hypothetical protein